MALYTNVAANPYAASSGTTAVPSMTDQNGGINWGNVIGAGAGALTGYLGGQSATNALNAGEQNAINTQTATQQQLASIFGTQTGTGNAAFSSLGSQLGLNGTPNYAAFNNSPGFQFAQGQGDQAIQRASSANGSLYTPNELAMLSQYNTGYASQNYNNYIQQLLSTAGLGAQGNQGLASGITQTSGNISQLQQNQGNAQAGGAANTSGIVSNLIGKVPWQSIYNNVVGDGLGSIGGSAGAQVAQDAAYSGAQGAIDSTASDVAASNADWLSSFSSAGGQAAADAGAATGSGVAAGTAAGGAAGATAAGAGSDVALASVGTDAATADTTVTGLGGAGLGAAAGAAAGIAGVLAPAIIGMSTPAVSLTGQYWNNYTNSLQKAISSGDPSQVSAQALGLLNMPANQVPNNIKQMIWQQGLVPYGTWQLPQANQSQLLAMLQQQNSNGNTAGGPRNGRY